MTLSMDLEREPTYWHLTLSGELSYGDCSQFRMGVHRILMSEPRCAVVDLSNLEYIESSGIGILLAMAREHEAAGGQLVLVTSGAVDSILELARLKSVFATASTLEEAEQILGNDAPGFRPAYRAASAAERSI
jgi:anti-anti-sigma factor